MPNPSDVMQTLTQEDRQSIIDKTIRYCWAIDTRDYSELDDVFAAEVVFDYGAAAQSLTGLDPLKKFVSGVLDPLDRSQHMVTNHEIEASELGPRSRCYFHAQHVRGDAEGGPNYIVAGIYTDVWRKTSGGWRSCHRTLEVLWTEGNPAVVNV